jgi:hypothetical protein
MIGYKKVIQIGITKSGHPIERCRVLKLEILGRSFEPFFSEGKLRTSKAKVLAAYSIRYSNYNYKPRIDKKLKTNGPYRPYHYRNSYVKPGFNYFVGQTATARLDTNPYENCGSGINFFMTMKKAINY